jgi:hypothetical protein
MAIAAEALSPEAATAVTAAAAGHGSRLTPEVTHELRKAAARKTTKATTPKPATGASSPESAVHPVARAASALNTQGAKVISGGKGGTAARIIFAFGAGLLALELASYVSGRYFTWNLKAGTQKLQAASTNVGLYPGQAQKLALQKTLPASVTVPGYAGTAQLA